MIFHVLISDDRRRARAAGGCRSETLDSDGFIRCCAPAELEDALKTYFPRRPGLLALHIKP